MSEYCAGIDLGTSGCRIIVIGHDTEVQAEAHITYPSGAAQTPELWWLSVQKLIHSLPPTIQAGLAAIAVDGTSGTILLTDEAGNPTTPALMYNDARATAQAQRIAALAPRESGAHGATSSLAKLLWLLEHYPEQNHTHALHQADWIAGKLAGFVGFSDENNCLKLGYDPITRQWPEWIKQLAPSHLLPQIYEPGTKVPSSKIVAGTTDSIAAFLATGAMEIGDAVTSLGSTIALKIISNKPVFAPEYGIYSHRLGNLWLAGGASNSGGAVLLHYFSREQLAELTPSLDISKATGLDYYPLITPGERFPWADPKRQPKMTPRPTKDTEFLQAILEGMGQIEYQGWKRLNELGAPWPKNLRTVGGGSHNPVWMQIRHKLIGAPMPPPRHTEAAYGAALLAIKAF